MGPTRATSDEKEGHYYYNNNNNNRNKIMEKKKEVKEAAASVVTMKFGDEQSDLLDQYERRSFEVHLNLAMQLGRSLSSPGSMFLAPTSPFLVPNTPPTPPPPPQLLSEVRQGHHRRQTGLKKVLWKLLLGVPMIIVRSRGKKKEVPDHKDPKFWKSFSRSLKI